jgi:NH3-dependent NAD+ synthetase
LPPYEILDDILRMLIEQELPMGEIMDKTLDRSWVKKIVKMVNRAEYKRQVGMPLGPKLKERAFGRGRRMPIAMELTIL